MGKNSRLAILANIQKKYNMDIEQFDSIEYTLDWTKVKCFNGYYSFNPQQRISGREIPSIKIKDENCLASWTSIIQKHHNHLPTIKYKVNIKLEIVFLNKEAFITAIPNLIKRLDSIKKDDIKIIITINDKKYNFHEYETFVNEKIKEQRNKQIPSSTFTDKHVLDWKNIIFLDNKYIVLPNVNGLFIKPRVVKKNCKKEDNNLFLQNIDKLPNVYFQFNNDFDIEYLEISVIERTLHQLRLKEFKQKLKEEAKAQKVKNRNKLEELLKNGIDPTIFKKTFTINWEDVYFYKNYYIFNPNKNNTISKHHIEKLHINDTRSRESFNFIIKYLMKRMPIIHYNITDNFTIKLSDTPSLEAAISFLVKEQAKYDIGVGEIAEATGRTLNAEKLTFASAMSKAANMKPEDFKKYKSQFINYLIFQQHKEYKVVPMSESITHSNITFEEATFIFTVKSWDNNLLLIIENVNPDRSTIIFKVYPNQYKDALQTIFDFMQSNLVNKRSSIRENSLTFSNCGIIKYWSCNHDSFNDWRERMGRHIDNH